MIRCRPFILCYFVGDLCHPDFMEVSVYFNKIKVSFSSIVIYYHMGHLANGSMAVSLAKQGVDRVSVTSGV